MGMGFDTHHNKTIIVFYGNIKCHSRYSFDKKSRPGDPGRL